MKIYYPPLPFAHTKLFVVDGVYVQIGSANMDPISLRLNFELNLEIYSAEFVEQLAARLRDTACWLFMPYL